MLPTSTGHLTPTVAHRTSGRTALTVRDRAFRSASAYPLDMSCRATAGALLILVAGPFAAGACTTGVEAEKAESPVGRTAAEDGERAACGPSRAREDLERFLRSSSMDGDSIVATFIAPEPGFQWFSTRNRLGMEVATDRSSLGRYFDERRARHVRQQLDSFRFNGVDAGHANLSFAITETSASGQLTYPGKGAIECASGKIVVWSEGAPQ